MDGELEKKRPETVAGMKRRVKKLWQDLDINMVAKNAQGMKKRLKSIITSRGEWTGD